MSLLWRKCQSNKLFSEYLPKFPQQITIPPLQDTCLSQSSFTHRENGGITFYRHTLHHVRSWNICSRTAPQLDFSWKFRAKFMHLSSSFMDMYTQRLCGNRARAATRTGSLHHKLVLSFVSLLKNHLWKAQVDRHSFFFSIGLHCCQHC
jgi:hypothetical protein